MALPRSGGRGRGGGALGALRVTAVLLMSFAPYGHCYVLSSRAMQRRLSVPISGASSIQSFRTLSTAICAKLKQTPAPTTNAYSELLSVVAAGDAVAFAVFAAIGRSSHSSDEGSLLATAAPFMLAWALAAPPLGAYKDRTSALQALRQIMPAVFVATLFGCTLRGLTQDHMPAPPFWVVSLVANTVLLGGWRMVYFLVVERTSNALDEFTKAIVDDDD